MNIRGGVKTTGVQNEQYCGLGNRRDPIKINCLVDENLLDRAAESMAASPCASSPSTDLTNFERDAATSPDTIEFLEIPPSFYGQRVGEEATYGKSRVFQS